MKDRVRESVFNLLGPAVKGKQAVDLFAGTGALGLESLSRGASRALFLEQHQPTAAVLRENIAVLGIADRAEVIVGNVFLRLRWQDRLGSDPWLVFVSPPWDFFVDRQPEMLELIGELWGRAPAGSLFAVESDVRFDPAVLPDAAGWDVRQYPPAVVAIGER